MYETTKLEFNWKP